MLLDELIDVTYIHIQTHELAEEYNRFHHCFFGLETFKVCFRHYLRPQHLPRRGQDPLRNTLPGHIDNFEAYHDVVMVLPELSKGEVCAPRDIKATAKQVLDEEILEIRNLLLIHRLWDMGGNGLRPFVNLNLSSMYLQG